MIIDTRLEFTSRVEEIDKMYKFLKDLDNSPILFYETRKTHRKKDIDEDVLKIMKASFFLLLYNVAESSIYNAMTDLKDTINNDGVKYSSVTNHIQEKWIKSKKKEYFENKSSSKIVTKIGNVANDIISLSFSGAELSGNTSATNIIKICKNYGFSSTTHYTCKNGRELNNVKDKRNILAHGNISFRECGKDYSVEDLDKIRKQVITYLRGILNNIENFINDKDYLI